MHWLSHLFRKEQTEKRLDSELRFHLERQVADYIAAGMTPEEARRRARLEFGALENIKEEVRDTRWETHLDDLFLDFRYALRNLRKDRRFALVAIFALALGIGASTVVFSAFYNLLFNAFAAGDADRLVVPSFESGEAAKQSGEFLSPLFLSLADYAAIRDQNDVFEDIVGYNHGIVIVSNGREIRQLYAAYVTANAFDFYGVSPLLGRGIKAEDGKPEAPFVFVMSYKTWKGEFNADPKLLGKDFTVNGQPCTLVGVMPPRFQGYGALMQVWMPINTCASTNRPGDVNSLARLKPGVTLEAASADLDITVKRLAMSHPADFPQHFTARVQSATDFLMGPWGIGNAGGGEFSHFGMKSMLYDLLAAVMILLLIACSNVANLLLARATARGKEIAIRSALGATRGRLIRQLLVESFVLALAACLLGCALAYFGMKGVVAAIPHKGTGIGGEAVIGIDSPVLLFTLGVTVLTTLICGLAPALHTVRSDLQPQLAGSGKGVSGNGSHGILRSVLVIGEVALSIVLLTGAGLMMRSFFLLTHIDLGFNLKNLLFVAFEGPGDSSKSPEQQEVMFQNIVQRLKTLPGVAEVAINNSLPGYNPGPRAEAFVPGSTHAEQAGFDGCSENLFRTLELQLLRGRWLSEGDVDSARHVAVINQTMALHFFDGEDAVGREIEVKAFEQRGQPPQDVHFQVIGVLRDVKNFGPQVPVIPMAFIPYTIKGGGILLLKTKVDPTLLMHAVQEQIWTFDRNVIFPPEFGPYKNTFHKLTYSAYEFGVAAFAPLAGIALLLVVIGVFCVMAYTVSLQTHEIGVRMALGAQQSSILKMVLAKGVRLVAAGIIIGLIASYSLTRFLASQIWGISTTDPWTFAAVVALVVLVGLAACLLPARRAAQVDPLVALRYE